MKLKALFLFLFVAAFFSHIACAQDDKTVSIKVTGSGKTLDTAKQAALRSAIEQAFGTFISAKTDILNDQVVSDQITSVSNGNIQKYDVLNETQLPSGDWATTLNAVVSISKLTSFVQAKGVTVEVKGGLFAVNIKQQMLNEQSEVLAIQNMMFLLQEPMLQAFDYAIESAQPKSADSENQKWLIPLTVTVKANRNLAFVQDYLTKNLAALGLSQEEAANYQSLNKPVYIIKIDGKSYSLRKKASLDYFKYLASNWSQYVSNFETFQGPNSEMVYITRLKTKTYAETGDEHLFYGVRHQSSEINSDAKSFGINFVPVGTAVQRFSWDDERSLKEIEGMTGYTVKPEFPKALKAGSIEVGDYYAGGLVAYIDGSGKHGLIVASIDIGIGTLWGCEGQSVNSTATSIGSGPSNTKAILSTCDGQSSAAKLCADLVANGYDDWFLPSRDELTIAVSNLVGRGFGYRKSPWKSIHEYWTSSESSSTEANFVDSDKPGREFMGGTAAKNQSAKLVRPIRAF